MDYAEETHARALSDTSALVHSIMDLCAKWQSAMLSDQQFVTRCKHAAEMWVDLRSTHQDHDAAHAELLRASLDVVNNRIKLLVERGYDISRTVATNGEFVVEISKTTYL